MYLLNTDPYIFDLFEEIEKYDRNTFGVPN